MGVSEDRKFTRSQVDELLKKAVGRTLGEVDKEGSNQFERTSENKKITGIAGDVIEQSVFRYSRDSLQECDIEVDDKPIEIKTTGVRVPKKHLKLIKGKKWREYSPLFGAKEGISITAVTLEPDIQRDFHTSHFWKKAESLLLIFYEYKAYGTVDASDYRDFVIVGFDFHEFSDRDKLRLRNDWELVRNYLNPFYINFPPEERREKLEGFTSILRPQLLLLELVPAYKRKPSGSFQNPRYRLKKTFVDEIVRYNFNKTTKEDKIDAFSSFAELDARCHDITEKFAGKTLSQLKEILLIDTDVNTKNFTSLCIIRMFGGKSARLNDISDFRKAGIIAKTITLTPEGNRTEDMKMTRVDFSEWADRDVDFEQSEIFNYFCEHSLLCPIFYEYEENNYTQTKFMGFKRFFFDDEFINKEVRKTWIDSRRLIHSNELKWEYKYDSQGNPMLNNSGTYAGSPNFPKSKDYIIFFRGGSMDSSIKGRTEIVNGIQMLPQFIWLKGTYIAQRLRDLPYL